MFTREKGSKIGQIAIRALLFLALILALAGFGIKFTGRSTTTIFLVDASDSVKESRNDLITFVNEAVKDKKRNDYVGVVAFGSNPMVEQNISQDLTFSKIQTDVNTGSTNLEDAVKLAISQIPEGSGARIVLLTDGNENEGTLKNIASDVVAKGCSFEIKKINENISDEVYVSDMNIPNQVSIGENFNIEVEVESNVACDAIVKLYAGRTLKGTQEAHLQKGTNKLIFSDTQSDEGLKTYKVVVEAQKDTVSVNNEFSSYTNIETQLPLLIVEGQDSNSENYTKILDAINVTYDVTTPGTVPVDMPTLMEYSAVVFIDVFEPDLRDGFTEILDEYVKNNGGGLIMTGGSSSFGVGGYRGTVLEDMSPVYMDLNGENEIPSMAMAMVIDHSGSMDSTNGIMNYLDLAKQSAAAAVDYLRPEDYVEVIAFDDSYSRVIPLQHVEDKEQIENTILNIPVGGGTSIYPALEAAIRDINDCDAQIKHIILLTDGQDYYNEYDNLLEILNSAGITLSCVAIGDGCNDVLLQELSDKGNGRMFYSDYDTDLPRIFAQEVFLASNTYIVEETFNPEVTSNDKIIREVALDGMPQLYGYVATSKKERSIELLQSFQRDPILAYWQYGLGKTVAWTSDVSGEWSSEYSNWDKTTLLWHNIIKLVSEDNGMAGTNATVEQKGNKALVTYTTEEYSANTKVIATVYDEDGNPIEVELDAVKPGVYETMIDTKDTGIYTINVQQRENDDIISSINTAAIMQYSLEYRFYPDNTLLEEFAASCGGVFVENPDEVFKIRPEYVKARFNLWIPLLIVSALIFLYDIAVRRFHFSFAFVDKMAAKRAKRKALKEENKRKTQADIIKGEKPKRSDLSEETNVKAANEKEVNAGISDNDIISKVPESRRNIKSKPGQNDPKDTGYDKKPSIASLKNVKKDDKKTEEKVYFERKEPQDNNRVYVKNNAVNPKDIKTSKTVDRDNKQEIKKGSVTKAALKTREWVRDNDK